MKKLMLYHTMQHGCKWYRIDNLKKALELSGKYKCDISNEMNVNHIKEYDGFVVQRIDTGAFAQYYLELINSGKPVIYETDDDVFNVPRENTSYRTLNNETPIGIATLSFIASYLRRAPFVSVSTDPLKKEMERFNKNILTVNNFINKDWIPKDLPERSDNAIIIGYGGSATHYADIKIALPAIKDLCLKYKNVFFALFGSDYKSLLTDFPEDKIIKLKTVSSMPDYFKVLSTFDISIAPLKENKFNQSKSWIKYLEGSVMGVPVVASDVYPYQIINDWVDGFKIKSKGSTYKHWYKTLERLILDKELRETIGQNAKQKILDEYMLEKNYLTISKKYDSIFKC